MREELVGRGDRVFSAGFERRSGRNFEALGLCRSVARSEIVEAIAADQSRPVGRAVGQSRCRSFWRDQNSAGQDGVAGGQQGVGAGRKAASAAQINAVTDGEVSAAEASIGGGKVQRGGGHVERRVRRIVCGVTGQDGKGVRHAHPIQSGERFRAAGRAACGPCGSFVRHQLPGVVSAVRAPCCRRCSEKIDSSAIAGDPACGEQFAPAAQINRRTVKQRRGKGGDHHVFAARAGRGDIETRGIDPGFFVGSKTIGYSERAARDRGHAAWAECQLLRDRQSDAGGQTRAGKIIFGSRPRAIPPEIDPPERRAQSSRLVDVGRVNIERAARGKRHRPRAGVGDIDRSSARSAGRIEGDDAECAARGRVNLSGPEIRRARDVERTVAANIATFGDEVCRADVLQRQIADIDERRADGQCARTIGRSRVNSGSQRQTARLVGVELHRRLERRAERDIRRLQDRVAVGPNGTAFGHGKRTPCRDADIAIEGHGSERAAAQLERVESSLSKAVDGKMTAVESEAPGRHRNNATDGGFAGCVESVGDGVTRSADDEISVERRGGILLGWVVEASRGNGKTSALRGGTAGQAAQRGIAEQLLRTEKIDRSAIALHCRGHGECGIDRAYDTAGRGHAAPTVESGDIAAQCIGMQIEHAACA